MCNIQSVMKNNIVWVVLGIVFVGAFLRLYHFEDWMHYQLDQARDFRVVHAAMEYGPGELPLQGPRAAGSFLRLGPLLYYLEYGSALVFGDTPAGSVMIIALLNILSIGIFYLFVRRFFDAFISCGLTGLWATSLFLIVYSRFGWNPTLLPFFVLLFAYALLRVNDRNNKHAGWWLVTAAIATAFIVNMHFVAFVTVPIIAISYLIWTRPRIGFRYWVMAIVAFIFLNVPLIVNDVKTGGENFQEFFAVVHDRGGNDVESAHSITDKVIKNTAMHVQYFWLIITGDQRAGLPTLTGIDIKCGYDCRHGMIRGGIALLFCVAGIASFIILYRRKNNCDQRMFLRLVGLWSVVLFVVYTPLAYDIAPRFFLLNAPLFFVFVGCIFAVISTKSQKWSHISVVVIIVIAIGAQSFFVVQYFHGLAHAATDTKLVLSHPDRILKEKTRVTFVQMEDIVDWMEQKHRENHEPVFVHAQPEYKRAFWERVDVRDIPRAHIPKDLTPLYRKGNYFIIIRTQSDQSDFLEKFLVGLDIVERKTFGTLTGYYLRARPSAVTAEEKIFTPKHRDPRFSKGVQPRYLWRQVFDGCTYNHQTDLCEK